MFTWVHILNRYLQKQSPNLATQPETEYLNYKSLLSIVASPRLEMFCDHGTFGDWPHATGQLGLNPLYSIEGEEGNRGKIALHRRFPSRFYEENHAESKTFIPETVEIDPALLSHLAEGNRTSAIEKLIEQYVLLGIPDNFCRRPLPTSAARALPHFPVRPRNDHHPREAA